VNSFMRIRASHAFTLVWVLGAQFAGCHSAQPSAPPVDSVGVTTASEADEAQRIADAALGKQAEILDRGDLARNGQEQLLVINRYSAGPKNEPAARITRAVVLEKSDGKWREIFRCDEHLKNPYGYLAAAATTVTGWDLGVGRDSGGMFEMDFTPAADLHTGERKELKRPTFIVRWNTKANRYQAYDRSQKRYLKETTALEMPESNLK
jgi:hypothetical protein